MLSGAKVTTSAGENIIPVNKAYYLDSPKGDPSNGLDEKRNCVPPMKNGKGHYSKFKRNRDATPFDKTFSLERICNEIKKIGLPGFGDVLTYHPLTGKPQKVLTYKGICSYQKLKHMVIDKIHARSRGGRTLLTHQPRDTAVTRIRNLKSGLKKLIYNINNFLQNKVTNNQVEIATHENE